MFFEETVRPRVSDADRGGRLSCEALLRLLEDVGTHHSAAVSDGVIENRGDGIIWVLVEWRLEILRRPADRETLTVTTWAMGQAPSAFIRRGYTVTDGEGREVLLAEGKFALFNSETGRPVRIDESMFAAYRPEERDVFASPAPKLRPLAAYRAETPFALRRDDIDFNGHVHNTLSDLSRLLNLSTRQTQRLLQQNFGRTFSQKLTEARMAAASQYLLTTELSVTEISERTGFSSIEHFSAAFRRFTGQSPRTYRKTRQSSIRTEAVT